jgi:eukaryotic-like serine/threonine-protein kinase
MNGACSAGDVVDGRWRLVWRLGRGAAGEIWRAVSLTEPGREPVALKLLHPELARDPEMVERFEREIATGQKVVHPNAVRIFGGGRAADGPLFLVMEEIRGRPLAQVAATEAPISPARVASFGRQIARALGAAHEVGVVHRDLKPENVLVVRVGDRDRAVVFDFGLSLSARLSTRLTAKELRIGTPGYMAPEYLSEGVVEPRCDLYALGVVLYELAAGEMPFAGTPAAVFRSQITRDPPPLATRCAAPGWLCAAVDALIRRDPEARPADAGAAARMLRPP